MALLPSFTTHAVNRWKTLFNASPENAMTLADLLAELSVRATSQRDVTPEGWPSADHHEVHQLIKNGIGIVYETRRNDAGQPELIVVSVFPIPEQGSPSSADATESDHLPGKVSG